MIWQVELIRTFQQRAKQPDLQTCRLIGFVTSAAGMYTTVLEEAKVEMTRLADKKKRNPSEINRDDYRYAHSVYTDVAGKLCFRLDDFLGKDTLERRLSNNLVLKFTELHRLDHPEATDPSAVIYAVKEVNTAKTTTKVLGYAKGSEGFKYFTKGQIERRNLNQIERTRLENIVSNSNPINVTTVFYIVDTKRLLSATRLKDLELGYDKVQLDKNRKQLLLKLDA